MSFILLLLVFVIQRQLDIPFSRVFDNQLAVCFSNSRRFLRGSVAIVLSCAFIVCLLLFYMLIVLEEPALGLGYFFIEFVLLLLLLGDSGFKEQRVQFSEACKRGDTTGAHHILSACYPREAVYRIQSSQDLRAQAGCWLIDEAFRRYFLVIFWFLVTGVAGALFARIVEQGSQKIGESESKQRLTDVYEVISLLPALILSVSFSISGNIIGCCREAVTRGCRFPLSSVGLLWFTAQNALPSVDLGGGGSSRGAAHSGAETVVAMNALRNLLNRCLGVWFMILALGTLAGIWL